MKELGMWLSNNWRALSPIGGTDHGFKITKHSLLWQLHQDKVWAEIAVLLGVDNATTSTPGWFGKRTQATANVLESMNSKEMEAFEAKFKKAEETGFPEDVKHM